MTADLYYSVMIATLLLFMFTAPVQSQGTYVATVFGPSGTDLVENCRQVAKVQQKERNADAYDAQACISYIAGVVDGGQFAARGDRGLFPMCFPPDVDGIQMAKIIVKYGDDHPEKLNNSGSFIVMIALRQAFPCRTKP